jgi:hypothetical protein
MNDGHVRTGRFVRVVVVIFDFIFFIVLKPSLPHELLKLSVAEHGDLLVSESALDTIAVPAKPIVCEVFNIRAVVESLLRIHEESVGFSVVAKVGELERKKVVLTTVSTYRMVWALEWGYLCDGRYYEWAWLSLHFGRCCSTLLYLARGFLCFTCFLPVSFSSGLPVRHLRSV